MDSESARRSSVTARRHKSRASRKATPRESGRQPGECRSAGEFSRLPDIPLDILYEILSLVLPMDLLQVSWTNKAFRTVLTNKSSRQVWVATFGNIPGDLQPPPCPEDLTEIEYANLLYNPCCMDCGEPRGRAYWTTRVRLCMDCIKDWVTVKDEVQDRIVVGLSRGNLLSSSHVLSIVPVRIPSLPVERYLFTKDLIQLKLDLEATDDKGAVVRRYEGECAAKVEFARVLERLDKIGGVGRGAQNIAVRQRRIDQIVERLANKGWGKGLLTHRKEYIWCITGVKGACVARPLTDKAWEKMASNIIHAMWVCKRRMDKAQNPPTFFM